ncbi:MAG: HAD family hydrolase [Methanobacteriota archaeon]|nr:MAG: HAD family hydrolase [Euryarchaeota archaeon]
MVEWLLFDLDNTLFACSSSQAEIEAERTSLSYIAGELNKDIAQVFGEFLRARDSIRSQERADRHNRRVWFTTMLKDKEVAERAYKLYIEEFCKHIEPYPDFLDVVGELSAKYKLGIATNGSSAFQRMKIKSLGFDGLFKQLFIAEEMGMLKSEEFYKNIENTLDVDGKDVAMVGDSPEKDVLYAQESGMLAILLLRGKYAKRESYVKNAIYSFYELNSLLDKASA